MADIFISYAREDEERVGRLAEALDSAGWDVFWDRRVPAGETWRSHIGRALGESSCVVVVWSSHSIRSEFVIEEAAEGKRRGVLVPLLFERVDPPFGFRELQAADLSSWSGDDDHAAFRQLIRDLASRFPAETPSSGQAAGQEPGDSEAACMEGPEEADDGALTLDTEERAAGPIPVTELFPQLRNPGSASGGQPGRNDPCPCGSGKKYKSCCGSYTGNR